MGTQDTSAEGHVRGSSLLLGGRILAILINFAGQVLAVRYLSRADYGAFAWALSIVALGTIVNLSGVSRAASRLMPAFDERGDRASARGTLWLAIGTVLGLGTAIVALVVGGESLIRGHVARDALSVELLVAAVLLIPLTAFDSLLQEVSAFLIGARAIFFRRHVLGPLLKLLAVVVVVAAQASVFALAIGHVVAGAIGVLAYVWMLGRAPAARWLREREVRWPWRDVYTFALPVLVTDALGSLALALAVVTIEAFHGAEAVAPYRAVVPVAGLILVTLQSFRFLFMPLASRLYERGATAEVGRLLHRSHLWIAVLSFPAFAVCFALSDPVVTLLFGERYRDAGELLALLSVATYVNATLGLGADTLMAFHRMRMLVTISVGALAVRSTLLFGLVPEHGALGAAIATTVTAVVHHVSNWVAVARTCGLRGGSTDGARVRIVAAAVVLGLVHFAWAPGIAVRVVTVVVTSAFVVATNRRALAIGATFPALRNLPLLGRWAAPAEDAVDDDG